MRFVPILTSCDTAMFGKGQMKESLGMAAMATKDIVLFMGKEGKGTEDGACSGLQERAV